MYAIDIKNLSFSYNQELILEDINLHVESGEFLAIIGPNGGGKTTLIKLILGLLETKSGTINLFGSKLTKDLRAIGYVPQNTNINTNFPIKVIEVVMMGHISSKRPFIGYKKEEIVCAKKSLFEVGMQGYENRRIGSLSGGQIQRVMIARALCANPKVILLDEPTSSIDVKGQREIYELLKELNKNMTVIVVSHDLSVILEYATTVAHINKKLSFHNMGDKNKLHTNGEHFCEVELLQMLGAKNV